MIEVPKPNEPERDPKKIIINRRERKENRYFLIYNIFHCGLRDLCGASFLPEDGRILLRCNYFILSLVQLSSGSTD